MIDIDNIEIGDIYYKNSLLKKNKPIEVTGIGCNNVLWTYLDDRSHEYCSPKIDFKTEVKEEDSKERIIDFKVKINNSENIFFINLNNSNFVNAYSYIFNIDNRTYEIKYRIEGMVQQLS